MLIREYRLSIVRHIIQDLSGDINFTSELGIGTEATVRLPVTLPMTANPAFKLDKQDPTVEVSGLTQGKTFSLEGFDRYPDISETPTGILSADFEGAMFLKSSMHIMLTNWFGMKSISTPSSTDKSEIDVMVIMESGVQSLHEKLQSYTDSRASIAIVLCSTYPPASTQASYGTLKVFYVPQPYGPHKMARALHHAFTSQSLADNIIPEINENHIPDMLTLPPAVQPPIEPTPPLVPDSKTQGASGHLSRTTDMSVPANPAHFILPFNFDRRASIDTSVIKSDGLRILLVEDNEINLKLLVAYMRKLQLNHSTAINGLEALNTYKDVKGQFDVIFMGMFFSLRL